MSRSSEPGFAEALQAVVEALGELPTPSMVIGGVAVIALGVPRFTSDIDVTIQGRSNHPEQVFGAFSHHEIGPRIESALEFAKARQVILALHEPSGISIDASLAWLPFEEEALQASLATKFAGVSIRVPSTRRSSHLQAGRLPASRCRGCGGAPTPLWQRNGSRPSAWPCPAVLRGARQFDPYRDSGAPPKQDSRRRKGVTRYISRDLPALKSFRASAMSMSSLPAGKSSAIC